ncbi:MAG: DUF1501 domain-containing protein [Planctomycetales bacterium]|nr:DUF1501 domain-containing protein [Planctomycetales bacterium]
MFNRREMLRFGGSGFGALAFAGMANQLSAKETGDSVRENFASPTSPREPHFPAKAKRVIFMFMQGGPSHVDTFDHKPELKSLHGKTAGKQNGKLMASPWDFTPCGESGLMISELFPNLGKHADHMCLINSMHTDNPAHPVATLMAHTGALNFVRPSMGSWVLYGLGTENQDLPGFITINPPGNLGGAQNYGSAFLPAAFQGTRVNVGGDPIANIRGKKDPRRQRRQLDLIQSMNKDLVARSKDESLVDGIIDSYELAFRMQSSVPDLVDIAGESEATKERYGINAKETSNFGMQCLMARRLSEAGVRFIEIATRGWDQHNNLKTALAKNCHSIDQPIAALMSDLEQRGMLDETLIVWTGEFGRTPAEQNNFGGRRHNNRGFTTWLAGGGVKGGIRYGSTDPTGDTAIENKVHTHDLHATILHFLGLDHTKLTYRYSGRDFRLTDVYGNVVKEIVA